MERLKEMLISPRTAKLRLQLFSALLAAVISFCVIAPKAQQISFFRDTVSQLENNRQQVIVLSGAILSTSLIISALPDDFATPLAETLADMNSYLVVILIANLVERLVATQGVRLAFRYLIPLGCVLYAASLLWKKKRSMLRGWCVRLILLAAAIAVVVPLSVYASTALCEEYLQEADSAIAMVNEDAETVQKKMTADGSESILDKMSGVFHSVSEEAKKLQQSFDSMVRKAMNAVAALVLTNVAMPLAVFWFFRWLLKELFAISLPLPPRHERQWGLADTEVLPAAEEQPRQEVTAG